MSLCLWRNHKSFRHYPEILLSYLYNGKDCIGFEANLYKLIPETMYQAAAFYSCMVLLVITVECSEQYEMADDETVVDPTGKKFYKTGTYKYIYKILQMIL